MGHGTALSIFAVYMLWFEADLLVRLHAGPVPARRRRPPVVRAQVQARRKKMSEFLEMAFEGRYALLLMGLAAVYCGLVYNDCMSVPLWLFDSTWCGRTRALASCVCVTGHARRQGLLIREAVRANGSRVRVRH